MTGLETWLAAQGLSFGYDRAKAGWSYKNSTKRKGFWADISDMVIGAGDPDLERRTEEERRKKIIADQQKKLMDAATLQTEAQRGQLNAQLAEATNQLNIQKAGMGAYRTGGRIKDISSMQTKTNEAVARVAKENVLQATLAGLGLEGNEQNYQLQLAQLELAKQAGDTDQLAGIAEQIGNSDFFTKLFQTQKPSSTVSNLAGSPASLNSYNYDANEMSSFTKPQPYSPSRPEGSATTQSVGSDFYSGLGLFSDDISKIGGEQGTILNDGMRAEQEFGMMTPDDIGGTLDEIDMLLYGEE